MLIVLIALLALLPTLPHRFPVLWKRFDMMDDELTTLNLPFSILNLPSEVSSMVRADNDSHCNFYRPKNSSMIVIIPGGYEGIPQNLLINVVAWVVSIITNCSTDVLIVYHLFLYLVFNHLILCPTKKCLELWKNGLTTKERKKVLNTLVHS